MKKFKFLPSFVMQKNDSRFKFSKAFSLIELMISLIVISLVAAAFVPVITKKLVKSSIVAGSMGNNGSNGVSSNCSKISEDCTLCAGDTCLSCKNKCDTGEVLNSQNCKCEDKVPYYMTIDGLYVTRFNMGDNKKTAIPSEAGVTVVATGKTCGSDSNYSTKCCWQGSTSGSSCDATNGDYSGCNRTVCNWAAANAICASYKQDGRTWRLWTSGEMGNWLTNSKAKGNEGLMLCDMYSGNSSARCGSSNSCPGASNGGCYPHNIWSASLYITTNAYSYNLDSGNWYKPTYYRTRACSVRCVSEIVPNCKTYSGETCTACKDNYYLKNDECKKHTDVSNCEAYASAEDKCEACEDGYYLSNNQCKKSAEVQNCETYSKIEDKCESCSSGYKLSNNTCVSEFDCSGQYFMKIGNLCVTKYNMGDSTETAIPSGAGVSVVRVGTSCGSRFDYSTKCCWQGTTSESNCDATNGDYSGCNRTVCTWGAADSICAHFKQGNKTWRLPTTAEMSNWLTYSKGKGDDGLMLCDANSSYSSAYCFHSSYNCPGSYDNGCTPYAVWSSVLYKSKYAYYYTLSNDSWSSNHPLRTYPFSVRCVTNL